MSFLITLCKKAHNRMQAQTCVDKYAAGSLDVHGMIDIYAVKNIKNPLFYLVCISKCHTT